MLHTVSNHYFETVQKINKSGEPMNKSPIIQFYNVGSFVMTLSLILREDDIVLVCQALQHTKQAIYVNKIKHFLQNLHN